MATIKVQREFMPALDKHYSILTVVLGRAAGAVGCWLARLYAPFVRSVWQEEFNRTRNGSGNGSIPESLRQRPGMLMPEPGHMVDKEAFPNFFFFALEPENTSNNFFMDWNTSILALFQTGLRYNSWKTLWDQSFSHLFISSFFVSSWFSAVSAHKSNM